MPAVSVILPVYNCEEYIAQALDSVFDQTWSDYEVIVVDDGSTDGTVLRLSGYLDRVRYVYQHNQGPSAARNTGLLHATGEYVAFLDGDDYWMPTYLEKQVANLKAHPDCALSYTWRYDADSTGTPVRIGGKGASSENCCSGILRRLVYHNCMSSNSVVVRSEALDQVGGFSTDLRQAEDWDLWLRIALRYPVCVVREPLSCYRHYDAFLPRRMQQRGFAEAHIAVVERAFAQLKGLPLYSEREHALSYAYWRGAWVKYAIGDIAGGQAYLTQSCELYPDFFAPPYRRFIEEVAYRADSLYDLVTPLGEALAHIDAFFDHLPPWASRIKAVRRRARGRYYGLHVFRSYERSDWAAVRDVALRAIIDHPQWLTNVGFCSITFQAFIPAFLRRHGTKQDLSSA